MDKPPPTENTLDSIRHSSNAKSLSKRGKFQKGLRQLQLPALIALTLVVYGITRSEQILPITHMLVGAFFWSMGFTPHVEGVNN
ncbi:MAG: hypothetical protein ACR2H5_21985 [Ktedonobacteraceae bacterium]